MKILVNSESLQNAEGGISRASRLFIKYLNKKKEDFNFDININCFRSYEDIPPFNKNIKFANNSKILFLINNIRGLLNNNLIIYDHIDLAKAHINILNKNYLLFGYGVDMWEMSKKQLHISKLSKKMFICSNFTLSKMQKLHNEVFENAEVCWLGSFDDNCQKKISRENKEINILILGRIDDDRKGHFLILEVWKEIIKKHKNIKLNIVGKSIIKDKIINKIEEYQIQETVVYHGYVAEDKIQKLWNETDIFIMPGTVEGFGFVYIEAMKNSVPIIASIHDAGNEINKNEVTGFNIDQFNNKELFNAIDVLIENENLRKSFSENAFKRFNHNFKFSNYENRMDNIFLNLIS